MRGISKKEMRRNLPGWIAQRSQIDVVVGRGVLGGERLVGDTLPRGLGAKNEYRKGRKEVHARLGQKRTGEVVVWIISKACERGRR